MDVVDDRDLVRCGRKHSLVAGEIGKPRMSGVAVIKNLTLSWVFDMFLAYFVLAYCVVSAVGGGG